MKYLSEMTEEQTLVIYSGIRWGCSRPKDAPRVRHKRNGHPDYSSADDHIRMSALGVAS